MGWNSDMRRSRSRLGWALVATLCCTMSLAACGGAEPTVSPQQSVALPSRTARPTFTPVPLDTPTAVPPTATIAPTLTPAPPILTPSPEASPTATSNPALSPLTGQRVADSALLKRRVLAVRIGNDPAIRPQEGLGLADIVYEEVMDGWTITRFTALYLDSEVERIRPIRSARLSSLAIAPQYDAALVHSGASDKIRWLLSQAKFVDLDQFFHEAPYGVLAGYDWRGRIYTSTGKLHEYLKRKGWEREALISGYAFDDAPPQGQPATSTHIPYPKSSVVDWAYDSANARYLRSVQEQPHLEGLTGQQISAENVIVLYAEHKKTDIVEDSLGSTAIDIVLQGSGKAQVCRDGVVIEARWEQRSPGELIRYYDGQGREIPLKPGRTWIQLAPTDYAVSVR